MVFSVPVPGFAAYSGAGKRTYLDINKPADIAMFIRYRVSWSLLVALLLHDVIEACLKPGFSILTISNMVE